MELSDKIIAVGKMQKFIDCHIDDEITLDDLSAECGYSKYYALRIFKELTGKTPFEVIRAIRLTKAATSLRDSACKVIDVALDNGFDSHDGFTKAFSRQFEITPQKYSKDAPAINYFVQSPIEAYYILKDGRESMPKEPIKRTMTVISVERPARKLILLRSVNATDYLSFCEEMGCEWHGLFNSISEKYDTAALLTLPTNLIKTGTGNIASGVEVPMDYSKPIPNGCDVIELSPCTMLYFHGTPYEDPNDFGQAIGLLWELLNEYNPKPYGLEYDSELAPYFNFGADTNTGAKMAMPARRI